MIGIRHLALAGGILLSMLLGDRTAFAEVGLDVFKHLDLNRPDLARVKKHVDAGDVERAAQAWLDHCRARSTPRWYWTPEELKKRVAFIRAAQPGLANQAIADAAHVLNHEFPHSCAPTVVRYVKLSPDFSFMDNPENDRQFLYSIHRHRAWDELGTAFVLTRDERYPREFFAQLGRWLDEVPMPVTEEKSLAHPMWQKLDAGIRAYRWAWPYMMFLHHDGMTPELHARWLEHVAAHAWLLRHHHAPIHSNWCTMQMYGLLTIALIFPELEGSDAWRDYAQDRLVRAIRAQIRPDGVQVEQSPSYHVGCVGWFAEPMVLGELNGLTWPADYRDRLRKMGEFTRWIIAPDGTLPALSDTDRSPRGRLALAILAMALDEPTFATRAVPEIRQVLMFGVPTAQAVLAAQTSRPAASGTEENRPFVQHFENAGYVVMRTGWDPEAMFAVFDCGPRGGGHGHYDLLSLEIHAFGQLVLADPGRWWYDDSAFRKEVLSTPAHNTISLDGQNHDKFEDPAGMARLTCFPRNNGWIHVRGEHHGYKDMEGSPVCRRDLLWDGDRVWIIADRVASDAPHDVLVSFLFGTQRIQPTQHQTMLVRTESGAGMAVVHENRSDLRIAVEPAEMSPVYGSREPAVRFRIRGAAAGPRQPFACVTLLNAFRGEPGGPGTLAVDHTVDSTHLTAFLDGRRIEIHLP